jgi:hypothetical protein
LRHRRAVAGGDELALLVRALRDELEKTRPERGFLRALCRTRTGDPFLTMEVLYQLS